jgi:prevent-host-death family protein
MCAKVSAMTKRMSVKDARANFADLLAQVRYGQEPVIVERKGRPMAVLISPEQWQHYQDQVRSRFFDAVDQLQALNCDADPEQVERDVAEAVEEVRRERHERRQRDTGRDT